MCQANNNLSNTTNAPLKSLAAGYPDSIAKGCKTRSKPTDLEPVAHCASTYILGEGDGKTFVKTIYCGKEHCKYCGKKDSIPHKRKIARWFQRWLSLKSWGYFVFTWPASASYHIDQNVMAEISTFVRRKFKRLDYDKGFQRWHYCGDDEHKWKPHLNVVVQGKFIAPGTLRELKESVCKFVRKLLGFKNIRANMNYSYTDNVKKATHILRYVTRATYRGQHNIQGASVSLAQHGWICKQLYKHRNSRVWGTFEGSDEERTDYATEILNSKAVKWITKISSKDLDDHILQTDCKKLYIGLGIYQLVYPPPEPTDTTDLEI
jgi:hypothetical protein